jgi:predicted outer membrane repeat protein
MSNETCCRFSNPILIVALSLAGIALLLGLCAGPASGAGTASPIYVRTDGHDTLCNGATDAPYPGSGGPGLNCAFATIQKGVDWVGSGGAVNVAAGTYTENVTIDQDLTLQGAGVDRTIVDGGASDSVLVIASGTEASISGLTIRNGSAPWGGGVYVSGAAILTLSNSAVVSNTATWGAGGIVNAGGALTISDSTVMDNVVSEGKGGGIYTMGGTLTLHNSAVASNHARGDGGGGIYNGGGTLTIRNSAIISNTADNQGGGIANWEGPLAISDSIMRGNRVRGANAGGGGLFNANAAVVTNVTFSGNRSDSDGGGIHNQEAMTLTNVTVSGNTAGYGGGILNTWVLTLTVVNSTIANNYVSSGDTGAGGIHNYGNVTFKNTILAHNQRANCWNGDAHGAVLTSSGFNLDSGTTCNFSATGDLNRTDPQLGPLADNGGPGTGPESATLTHALLEGSPAIDAGTNAGCPVTDQRGVSRPADGDLDGTATCDIGAYEYALRYNYVPIILKNH